MEKVSIEDVEPRSLRGEIDRRGPSDPLDTEDVAINRYRLDPGEEPLVAFGIGAPRGSRDVRVPRACPACGHQNLQAIPGDDGMDLVCPECEAEVVRG